MCSVFDALHLHKCQSVWVSFQILFAIFAGSAGLWRLHFQHRFYFAQREGGSEIRSQTLFPCTSRLLYWFLTRLQVWGGTGWTKTKFLFQEDTLSQLSHCRLCSNSMVRTCIALHNLQLIITFHSNIVRSWQPCCLKTFVAQVCTEPVDTCATLHPLSAMTEVRPDMSSLHHFGLWKQLLHCCTVLFLFVFRVKS